MKNIYVAGGSRLKGEVVIQGSKNLAIPCLAASILFKGKVTLHNIPDISDVRGSVHMLEELGAVVERKGSSLIIDSGRINNFTLDCVCEGGRSSILYCGPLLARFGACSCASPKGCKIGKRPTDLHQMIFERFGGKKNETAEELAYKADKWLGCEINLPIKSVGATESAILSGVLAEGKTIINNCAVEPEVKHLCEFLVKAGADIEFDEDCGKITVSGVRKLRDCEYTLAPDRIVAGTYLIYCCMCGGKVALLDAPADELDALIHLLKRCGAEVFVDGRNITLTMNRHPVSVGVVETDYYPGFPTDFQSLLLALEAVSEGESIVVENIFESRFETAALLNKMGACISIEGNTAYIKGVQKLTNCDLYSPDLRGGAAVLGAMLTGVGKGCLGDFEIIERGYEDIVRDLRCLGFTGLED
ncbi:MAG: UDP-N-acetylglucosamine 1-carboxyvinyltransferase [Lachnospiraceae bacterium]|nr:UDP-N-acetylglucosamine 1-carboxyvinyltransferase [Lachnospiraceae bacterium]